MGVGGKKTEKRGTEGRTQENKSTGDRNAQLSSEPEARSALTSEVCASAPLWSSAWHSLHYNNVFKTRGGGRKKNPKKITNRHQCENKNCAHTHSHAVADGCANTQDECSKAAARCKAEMAWGEIKKSHHIDSGMTEGQKYAALQKNEKCFP